MVCQPAMSKVKPPPRRLCRNGLEVGREQTNGFQSFRTRSIINFIGEGRWWLKSSLFILLEPLNPNAEGSALKLSHPPVRSLFQIFFQFCYSDTVSSEHRGFYLTRFWLYY